MELFCALDRLKGQYEKDLRGMREEFKRIENQYDERIRDMNLLIDKMKEEQAVMDSHLRQAESQHHQLAKDK